MIPCVLAAGIASVSNPPSCIPESCPGRHAPRPSSATDPRPADLDPPELSAAVQLARDEAQVRPLLPGSAPCLVVVTSRRQMAGLAATECAQLMNIDVLTDAEAHEMLCYRLGPELVEGEAEAVIELISLCARLPQALAIAAARHVARPARALKALVEELRPAQDRLTLLDATDVADAVTSARAVFSWSYQSLTQPAARMFRLLAVHPGPDITAAAAASVAGLCPERARPVLTELVLATCSPSTPMAGTRVMTCSMPTLRGRPADPIVTQTAGRQCTGCWTITCTPPSGRPGC